ncbi:MAG: replication-associated protein [Circular genetic element sp.]|nr:MAG: replication-associated protein [Circular genetic element sp.]
MQLKRCFITIHYAHLEAPGGNDSEENWRIIFKEICDKVSRNDSYEAGALALEMGEKLGRIHIQGYLEHKPKRLQTLANDLGVMKTCFDIVKDAKGSWDYCSGLGKHEGKFAFDRFTFGEPKLYGSKEKVELNDLVNLVISGCELREIMVQHPYAYCVHRDRLRKFSDDWSNRQPRKSRKIDDPLIKGFIGQAPN